LHNRSVALMVSALVLGLLVAGCGGGSNGGESSGGSTAAGNSAANAESGAQEAESGTGNTEATATGKAAFLKQANAICAADKKKIEAEVTAALPKEALSESAGKARIEDIVSTVVATGLQSRLDAIRALGTPSEAEAEVNAALDLMQEQVEEAKTAPRRFAASREAETKANNPIEEVGLTDCTLGWL
jgi:hypothetical protein